LAAGRFIQNPGADFGETIVVYKLPRLGREEIQAMLGLKDVDLKQTRFYQDVLAEGRREGRQEGRQEGRREGRREGRQEGRQEGEALLVIRLLKRRFGDVNSVQEARIRAMSAAKLETLAEALLDFRSLADLDEWLGSQG
jgi:predicted transposase YdaD